MLVCILVIVFCFKQKTAYEMRISDWSSDVCSSDLVTQVITTGLGDMLGFPKGAIVNFVLKYVKKMVPDYDIPDTIRFNDALALGQRQELPEVSISHDDIAFLQYTGGTTGVAKGAMLTHRNLVANMQQASAWVGQLVREGEEIIIPALPLYHILDRKST